MRQGQQNRRGRSRSNSSGSGSGSNNGRKAQNPLSRNYESNGPDVKIRGTAAQVAEKYMALARDATASGDIITAENHLQHAEHYNRIIMAAQQAQVQPSPGGQPSHENGRAAGTPQRIPADGDGAMRDQPQPHVVSAPIPTEQPVIADSPAAEQPQPAQPAPAAKEAEGGRRRRRRYPGNGAERASGASETAAGNGHARGGETGGEEERSSDEAAA